MKIDVTKDMLHAKKEYTDSRNLVEEACEMYKDRIAYSFRKKASDKEKVEIPFTKVRDDVRALTTELLARGYYGKKIIIYGENSLEWATVFLSLVCGLAVAVTVDKDIDAEKLAKSLS